MKSYVFESTDAPNGSGWGLGAVLSDAECSTGQTVSSSNWATISSGLKGSNSIQVRRTARAKLPFK